MTVLTTNNSVTALGNGTATVFPFNFVVYNAAHIDVFLTALDGTVTQLNSSQYSLSGVNVASGGNVTLQSPLASGVKITIRRDMPYVQDYAVSNQNTIIKRTLERTLDLVVQQIQQLAEVQGRSVVLPVSWTGGAIGLPLPQANKYLAWNGAGDALVNVNGGSGGGGVTLPIDVADITGLGDIATLDAGSGLSISNGVLNVTGGGGGGGSFVDLTEVNRVNYLPNKFADIFTIANGGRVQFSHTNTFQDDAFSFLVERYANQQVTIANDGDSSTGASLKVFTRIANGNADFEWNLAPTIENYGQGENCAMYATGLRMSATATGGTWAGVFEARDLSGSNNSSLYSIECDLLANGTDILRARTGVLLAFGRGQKTAGGLTDYTAPAFEGHAALAVESFYYDTLSAFNAPNVMFNGLLIGDAHKRAQLGITRGAFIKNAINIYTEGDAALIDRGTKGYGLLLESTYNLAAIQIPTNTLLSFNAANSVALRDFNGVLAANAPFAAASVSLGANSGNIINHVNFGVQNNGIIEFKNTGVILNDTTTTYFHNGQSTQGGAHLLVNVLIQGQNGTVSQLDRYIELKRRNSDN